MTRALQPFPVAIMFVAVVASCVAGLAATSDVGPFVIAGAAAATVLAYLVARLGVGVALALLVLLVVDGLPGPSLLPAKANNIALLALPFVLLGINVSQGWEPFRRHRSYRLLGALGGGLLLWWALTMLRTLGDGRVPLYPALLFSRDFFIFGPCVPLFAGALYDRRTRRVFVVSLAIAAAWLSIGSSLAAVGLVSPQGVIAHATDPSQRGDLTRLYSLGDELITAAFFFAMGGFILGTSSTLRRAGGAVALVSFLAILLSLGRARYIGVVVAILFCVALWWGVRRSGTRTVGGVGVALAAVLIGATLIGAPILSGAASEVTKRVSTIFASTTQRVAYENNDTLLYREQVSRRARAELDATDWFVGLGYLDPNYVPFPATTNDSVRDTDLGYLNGVIPMGLVGTGLIFALVLCPVGLFARARLEPDQRRDWLVFGALGYALCALVTSVSLVSLFSPEGLTVQAASLGLGTAALFRP